MAKVQRAVLPCTADTPACTCFEAAPEASVRALTSPCVGSDRSRGSGTVLALQLASAAAELVTAHAAERGIDWAIRKTGFTSTNTPCGVQAVCGSLRAKGPPVEPRSFWNSVFSRKKALTSCGTGSQAGTGPLLTGTPGSSAAQQQRLSVGRCRQVLSGPGSQTGRRVAASAAMCAPRLLAGHLKPVGSQARPELQCWRDGCQ